MPLNAKLPVRLAKAIPVCLLAYLAACRTNETPLAPTVNKVDSVTVTLATTPGMTTNPAAGSYRVRPNDHFRYAFTAAKGFSAPAVRINDTTATSNADIVITGITHITAVAFPDTSAALRTASDALFDNAIKNTNAATLNALITALANANVSGDTAVADDLDRAQFSAFLKLGPELYYVLLQRMDDVDARTPLVTMNAMSESVMASASTASPQTLLLPVNGVLTGPSGAAANRLALTKLMVGSQGANGVRSWGVITYHNPEIRLDGSSLARCVKDLLWFRDLLGRGGRESGEAVLLRLYELMSQRRKSECFNSNARVISDYLVQLMGQHSALTPDDVNLLNKIEAARNAGSNIVIVPHSQGNIIVRNVLAQMSNHVPGKGCVGMVQVSAPIQYTEPIPNVYYQQSVIARGKSSGVYDFVWPLWPGRTDGMESKRTMQVDSWWVTQGLNWLTIDGGLILDIMYIPVQIWLHLFDNYTDTNDGLGYTLQRYVNNAADQLDASCSWALLDAGVPSTVTMNEGVLDTVNLTLNNLSPYKTRVTVQPIVQATAHAMIEFRALPQFELAPKAKGTYRLPVLVKKGIVPGQYTVRYAISAAPANALLESQVVTGEISGQINAKVPSSNWTVTDDSAEVWIRAQHEVRDSVKLSIQMNDGQRKDFTPNTEWSVFRFQVMDGNNSLEMFTEYLPRLQGLGVHLDVLVKNAVAGEPRTAYLGPLQTRGINNPSASSVRKQISQQ